LIAYLQALRTELRPSGLQVSTISPGYLRTALTAGNRFAMPGLLSPEDAAMTLIHRVSKGAEQVVLPRRMGWLSKALDWLPERLHDRILLGQPRKPRPGEPGSTAVPGLGPTTKPEDKR
jgi:short-subunit dehydrogenase